MFEELKPWEGWSKYNREYLKKRLNVLIKGSIVLENGCIIWGTNYDRNPFHKVSLDGLDLANRPKCLSSYRFIAFYKYGPIISNYLITHSCKTTGCHHENHSDLGNAKSNALDRHRDLSMRRKLDEKQVLKICKNKKKLSHKELGKLHKVSTTTIYDIMGGRSWTHLTGIKSSRTRVSKEYSKEYVLNNKDAYIKKIEDNVDSSNSDECWNWSNTKSRGYGVIDIFGNKIRAHVLAWSLENDRFPILGKEVVRHRVCNNRSCVNILHLRIGSHGDNMKDRNATGEKCVASKLKEFQVIEIINLLLEDKEPLKNIAKKYGVSKGTIANIRDRETWPDIERDLTGVSGTRTKKTTFSKVANIKFLLQLGEFSIGEISRYFEVGRSTVSNINSEKYFKYVEAELSEEGEELLETMRKDKEEKKKEREERVENDSKLNGRAKLTENQVIEIIDLLSGKDSLISIARRYGVTTSVINNISNGVTWKHVPRKALGRKKGKRLTEDTVSDIKYILTSEHNLVQARIASLFDISSSTLSDIKNEKRWKKIKPSLSEEGKVILDKLISMNNSTKSLEKVAPPKINIIKRSSAQDSTSTLVFVPALAPISAPIPIQSLSSKIKIVKKVPLILLPSGEED
jgi:hypothetical protein